MAIGISIHIGVNAPADGCCSKELLSGAEAGALLMRSIATHAGFRSKALLLGNRRATFATAVDAKKENLKAALRDAASLLRCGDILLVTFSGHGCRESKSGGPKKKDTWCLADDEMSDAELYRAWTLFRPGVRILVIVDSCDSEGIAKPAPLEEAIDAAEPLVEDEAAGPEALALETALATAPVFDEERNIRLQVTLPQQVGATSPASVLFLVACKIGETARDASPVSLFATVLDEVWDGGHFFGDYQNFIGAIRSRVSTVNSDQHPAIAFAGPSDEKFEAQRPFTLDPPVPCGAVAEVVLDHISEEVRKDEIVENHTHQS